MAAFRSYKYIFSLRLELATLRFSHKLLQLNFNQNDFFSLINEINSCSQLISNNWQTDYFYSPISLKNSCVVYQKFSLNILILKIKLFRQENSSHSYVVMLEKLFISPSLSIQTYIAITYTNSGNFSSRWCCSEKVQKQDASAITDNCVRKIVFMWVLLKIVLLSLFKCDIHSYDVCRDFFFKKVSST